MANSALGVSILTNGREAYASMLSDIRSAKQEIVYANFCFLPGRVFERLSDELINRARAGVSVYIVADRYGSSAITERQVTKLRKAGVHWVWFRPKRADKILSYNRRMHKKILIIDRRIAYTGGIGIADFWERADKGYPRAWRDTHFRITDPVAAFGLYNSAIDSWNKFSQLKIERLVTPKQKSSFKIINSVPPRYHRPSAAGQQFVRATESATSHIRVTTAYFGPSKILRDSLVKAAGRGVRVELLLNGPHASHQIAWLAGQSYYSQLLEAGVKIYEYQPTKLHAKLMTVDGRVAIIGSANWNFRSLYHDQECNAAVLSAAFCKHLDSQFQRDLAQSKQVITIDDTQRLKQRLSSIGRYFF